MASIKVIIKLLLLSSILICNGQFLTPDQLREQNDLGYGARTHYEMTSARRTDMFDRINPDYLLRGFFPFWSIVLICFGLIFLTLAVFGLIGYLLGCRRPTLEELYANEFEQLTPDDEFLLGTGEISNMNDTKISIENSSNGVFNNNNYYQRDFRYESLLPIERARIGQSHEDTV
ncbi:unnamed protein product [Rotaria sp. Silwood2]|nr:unnamed protein product [Rotaria sp. Silwood2]CAF2759201.1 unnamed protein product [Rotaria sp. Silwood2]CAF2992932.1 unnamed protein product [Rotaria sp. Silwood2]CAF3967303.1 unnamed protein product [Rotaria sp. Silwood2]CAF3972432.1 unnamed protein product [Rotaria sp. Silwood2]